MTCLRISISQPRTLHILRYNVLSTVQDGGRSSAEENSADLFRTLTGSERYGNGSRSCRKRNGHAIGKDLLRAQWRWPVGMPLCRAMGSGLWEIRTDLLKKRTARVLICVYREHLVALHGFIKKTARRRTKIWG
jgi:hypothetical protein